MTRFALDRGAVKEYADTIVAQNFQFSMAAADEAKGQALLLIRNDSYIFPPLAKKPVRCSTRFLLVLMTDGASCRRNQIPIFRTTTLQSDSSFPSSPFETREGYSILIQIFSKSHTAKGHSSTSSLSQWLP